jgi:hypothetical protein
VLAHVLDPVQPFDTARTRGVVRGWLRLGLVECRRVLTGASPLVWSTRAGLRASALAYEDGPPPVGLLAHLHAVSLVRLGVERLGGTWTSERCLARERVSAEDHVADAIVRTACEVDVAVEVELTPKGASRLRLIVDELVLDHDQVVYVVSGRRVRARVQQAVDALECQQRVTVVDLAAFALPTSPREPRAGTW